jgi:hypothetical protein
MAEERGEEGNDEKTKKKKKSKMASSFKPECPKRLEAWSSVCAVASGDIGR